MTGSKQLRVSLIQIKVSQMKEEAISNVIALIRTAVSDHKARVVALPESFATPYDVERFNEVAEFIPSGYTSSALSNIAKELDIYVVGGSIIERDAVDANVLYNTCTVWAPNGSLIAKHRKVHLAVFEVKNVCIVDESSLRAGREVTTFWIDGVKCGVGICYDINFDDFVKLYRKEECDLMFFPSAFHESTGPINWEILPRARACDNQFYVAAINSARDDTAKWVTWGRSMIIDPRGETIVQAGQAEQIVSAVIDTGLVQEFRQSFPLYSARRTDLYDINKK